MIGVFTQAMVQKRKCLGKLILKDGGTGIAKKFIKL